MKSFLILFLFVSFSAVATGRLDDPNYWQWNPEVQRLEQHYQFRVKPLNPHVRLNWIYQKTHELCKNTKLFKPHCYNVTLNQLIQRLDPNLLNELN